MMTYLTAVWAVMLELAPWLLLGAALSGLLHVVLPPGFFSRHLRGKGGVARAVLFGVPLPLCSCGVIPTGVGLKRDGASDGASVGFLIATPQTGVDSLVVSASMLGWPFAVFKLASATITGLIGGWWVDRGADITAAPVAPTSAESSRDPLDGLEHAVDVLRVIWRWLVFGVLVSAALSVWLPPGSIAEVTSLGALGAALLALAISVPLYVCATASVPIAAALVAGGFPPGAALVFLMAGPATNVATIGAVARTFGKRNLAIYLTTIIGGSLAFGLLFDMALTTEAVDCAHCHTHDGTSVQITMATLLTGLFLFYGFEDIRAWLGGRPVRTQADTEQELELPIDGLTCNGCVRKLQSALAGTDGVTSVEVSREPGRARVRTRLGAQQIAEVVQRTGFSVPT